MTTKAERHEKDEMAADQHRTDAYQAAQDRLSHLVDPMTDPSSGDPPPAMTPSGDRLGAVPVTRNAQADLAQAQEEGRQAAEQHEPTKAEKASGVVDKPTARKSPPKPKDDAPVAEHVPAWNPFRSPESTDNK